MVNQYRPWGQKDKHHDVKPQISIHRSVFKIIHPIDCASKRVDISSLWVLFPKNLAGSMTSGAVQQTEPWNAGNWRRRRCDFTMQDRPKSAMQQMRRSLTCTFAYHVFETDSSSYHEKKKNTPLWCLCARWVDPDCADSWCHSQFHIFKQKWESPISRQHRSWRTAH